MLVLSDRVKQTSITSGSGTLTLNDTFGGFQSFANAIGNGNATYYTIENGSKYEVGVGTYNSNTLSRDLVLSSSNNNERIDLEGVSIVFCTYPADYSFFLNQQGYASGQMPHYSGIAFPDGTFQTAAALQSFEGQENTLAYWSSTSSLSNIDEIVWSPSSSGLFIDADVDISGSLEVRNTWFYRDSAGCFFHAYVDNTYDNMVALHSNNSTSPTWKLGIKPYSENFTTEPIYGWVEGTNGRISLNANSSTKIIVDYNNGFSFTQQSNNILVSEIDTGTIIYNINSATVPLTVKGAAAQSENLQEWTDYSDSVVASVSSSGQIDISSIKFPDSTVQTTAFRATQVYYKTITSSTYLDPLDDVVFADCSSSSINIVLPTASGVGGKKIIIKRKAGGLRELTISPSGFEELDSSTIFNMPYDNQSITVISDNSNWFII
jgi:hypothetical protein